ncbi:MAG: PD-(D/E)XK nuclease family protein, partial [Oscillospiraceae bacterium]|nr:PD-(D/E)XK nuclease family protein [Oscillospiraceae bacterium]
YRAFLPYTEAAEGEGRKILLSQNFRSRKEILEATNFVFENIMSLSAGEMDYGEEERLNFGAAYFAPKEGCETEYHLLNLTKESLLGAEKEEAIKLAELEARFLARKVRSLLEEGFPVRGEDGQERSVREEDIVILMRSPNTRKELLAKALWNEGIAFSEGGSEDFFETAEIAVMFSFLKIIDNPRQDVPLISVMRSPLFGFTADRLAEIRAASPATDFYTALTKDEKEDSLAFLRELAQLRELAPEISVHRLLWHIYDRFHVLGIFGAMGGGNVRKENLTALFEHVKKLENAGYSGLFQLVTQLQRMIENGEMPDTNIRTASGGVRLMSIHKSKGLEFPVVILADLSKAFNDKDLNTPVLVHPKLGVGAERVDLIRSIRYPTVARLAIEQQLKSESHAEEMRILYVAMSRAKEKLILVDSRRNAANIIKKLIPSASCPAVPDAVQDGKCMGDWILLPLLCRWEAKPLRDLAGMDTLMHYSGDDALWKVFIHDAGEYLKVSRKERSEEEKEGSSQVDFSALDYVYPYRKETALPAKITATQLKGREVDEEIAQNTVKAPRSAHFARPAFMEEERALTAAEKGTALHLVMQYIDFSVRGSEEEVQEEVQRLLEKRLLREKEARAVDAEAIAAFLASSLAQRIREAENLWREYRFTLLVSAKEFDPAAASDDEIMLQGVVDCCIEEDGELTVIDFKTDRVGEAMLAERSEEYRPQLEA